MKFSEQRDLEYRFGKASESLDKLIESLAKDIAANPKTTAHEHQRNIAETVFSVAPARVLIDLLGVAIYRAAYDMKILKTPLKVSVSMAGCEQLTGPKRYGSVANNQELGGEHDNAQTNN